MIRILMVICALLFSQVAIAACTSNPVTNCVTPIFGRSIDSGATQGDLTILNGLGSKTNVPLFNIDESTGAINANYVWNVNSTWLFTQSLSALFEGAIGLGMSGGPVLGSFQIHQGANNNLIVTGGVSVAGAAAIQSVNDADTVNIPLEFRTSYTDWPIGSVGIGITGAPSSALQIAGTTTSTHFIGDGNAITVTNTGSTLAATLQARFANSFLLNADDFVLPSDPDDTAGVQRALTQAGVNGHVVLNCRTYNLSATLVSPGSQWIQGCGPNQTQFNRTANYGDTLDIGSHLGSHAGPYIVEGIYFHHGPSYVPVSVLGTSAGVGGICLLRVASSASFTAGQAVGVVNIVGSTECNGSNFTITVPDSTHIGLVDTTWANAWVSGGSVSGLAGLTTSSAHINAYDSQGALIYNNWFLRLNESVELQGGSITLIQKNNFAGIYDPLTPALQEGLAEIYLTSDFNGAVPTTIQMVGNNLTGAASPPSQVTYVATDRSTTITTLREIGPQYGVYAQGCEDCLFDGNYDAGMAIFGMNLTRSSGSTTADWRITNNFFDSSMNSDIAIDPSELEYRGVVIASNDFNGEALGVHAIYAANVSGAAGVYELSITGNSMYAYLGSPIYLQGAQNGSISGNTITSYNDQNISLLDPTYTAGVFLFGTTNLVNVVGNNICGHGSYTYDGIVDSGTNDLQSLNMNAGCTRFQTQQLNGTLGAQAPATAAVTTLSATGKASVNLNTGALPTALTGTALQIQQADTVISRAELDVFANTGVFSCVRGDGTRASSSAVQSGEELCSLNAWGYTGVGTVSATASAAYRVFAAENWSSGHQGSYLRLATTADAATTLTDRLGVENDGGVTVPPTVTGGSKGSGTLNVTGPIYVGGTQIAAANLLNGVTGSGAVVLATAPAIASPTFSGTVAGANTIPLSILAQSAANTMVGNWTGSTANVAANAMPSCSDAGGNHLNYVSGTGIVCGTSDSHGGTVTSIATTAPLAGGTITTTGTLSITGAAGQVLAGASPAFTATPTLGVAGSVVGSVAFANLTSGTITMQPATGALGAAVLSLPAATDTLMGKATTDIFTNKTFDTAATGNVFKINGTAVSAVTGSGAAVLATSPVLVTPTLGVATATSVAVTGASAPANGMYLSGTNVLDLSTNTMQRFEISATGTFGIGSSALADRELQISAPSLSGASQYGAVFTPTFTSSATTGGDGFNIQISMQSAAFTQAATKVFHIVDTFKGAGSAITTQYGLYVDALSAGATNWALFTAGTTPSTFGGSISAGTTSTTGTALNTSGTVYMASLTSVGVNEQDYLCLTSANQIVADTTACLASSRQFKNIIGAFDPAGSAALIELLRVPVDRWRYKPEGNFAKPDHQRERIGPLAEDLAAIDSRLVGYDGAGHPTQISTEQELALAIRAIQELDTKVEKLERTQYAIDAQRTRNATRNAVGSISSTRPIWSRTLRSAYGRSAYGRSAYGRYGRGPVGAAR